MYIANVKFPAILYDKQSHFLEFVQDITQLSVTTKLGFKKRSLSGLFLLSSNGTLYEIVNVQMEGNYYPFWKFEFFNPLVRIHCMVEEMKKYTELDEFKSFVTEMIFNHAHNKQESYSTNKVISRIQRSDSLEDVILVVRRYLESF